MLRSSEGGLAKFGELAADKRVQHAIWISTATALVASVGNAVIGVIIAWVLVRYRFWGRRILDALVDFPFALPTAVAGLTFSDLFIANANKTGFFAGWWNPVAEGLVSAANWGLTGLGMTALPTNYLHGYGSPFAIVLVLMFTGFPFVVRTVQPVLEDLDAEFEEAAASMGASRWQTFRLVIWPELLPAVLTGMALSFARGVGEYGAVIFVSGQRRGQTEIVPEIINEFLSNRLFSHAAALALILLIISFVVLLGINLLGVYISRRSGRS